MDFQKNVEIIVFVVSDTLEKRRIYTETLNQSLKDHIVIAVDEVIHW